MEKIILKTKRLNLRPLKKGDEETILQFANNPKIAKYLTYDTPVTLEKEAKYVAERERRFGRKGFYFIAFEKKTKEFAGLVDLHCYHDQYKRAEVGLWVQEGKWRQGFGEEIARAIIDFGFKKLKLNRIEYCTFVGNTASEKLIKKLGGKLEGIRRDYFVKNGKKISDKIYSILAKEWKAKKK